MIVRSPGVAAAVLLLALGAPALLPLEPGDRSSLLAATANPQKERRDKFQSRFLGQPAPDFTLVDVKGKSVRLRDLRGKVVLLNFW